MRIDALRLEVPFAPGEAIYTESSYKYSSPRSSGWRAPPGSSSTERWLDGGRRFSVNLLAPLSG